MSLRLVIVTYLLSCTPALVSICDKRRVWLVQGVPIRVVCDQFSGEAVRTDRGTRCPLSTSSCGGDGKFASGSGHIVTIIPTHETWKNDFDVLQAMYRSIRSSRTGCLR